METTLVGRQQQAIFVDTVLWRPKVLHLEEPLHKFGSSSIDGWVKSITERLETWYRRTQSFPSTTCWNSSTFNFTISLSEFTDLRQATNKKPRRPTDRAQHGLSPYRGLSRPGAAQKVVLSMACSAHSVRNSNDRTGGMLIISRLAASEGKGCRYVTNC